MTTQEQWKEEFDTRFTAYFGQGLNDSVHPNIVKDFISSLLDAQRAELVEKAKTAFVPDNDAIYCNCDGREWDKRQKQDTPSNFLVGAFHTRNHVQDPIDYKIGDKITSKSGGVSGICTGFTHDDTCVEIDGRVCGGKDYFEKDINI